MSAPRNTLRPWVIGLGLLAVGLTGYLLLADTPWDAARESAERIAAGKRARPEADFVTALWITAAANLFLVLALLATVRLWAPRLALTPIAESRGFASRARKPGAAFWLPLLGILLVAGGLRLPLASGSLWWDELWGIKYGIVGYYIGEEDARVEDRHFAEANWRRALWYYTRPTNHPAASFPARLSHVVWKSITRPVFPHLFSDLAVRFPNFLASLAAVGALGMVGLCWGRPALGLLAATVLALHPWAIRYGVDLRGYSWVMLWSAVGLLWLAALFREGRARWWPWWGLGINQALLVWAFPHAVFVALGFFLVAGLLAWRAWSENGDRFAAWGRLVLVNVVGGMIFLQVFSPNLLQTTRWIDEVNANHTAHALDARLLGELATDLLAGQPWRAVSGDSGDAFPGLTDFGVFRWPFLALVVVSIIWGWMRLWRVNRSAAWILGSLVVAGGVLLIVFKVVGAFFYPRFAIFLVIPFALLLGAVGDGILAGAGRRMSRFAVAASLTALVAIWSSAIAGLVSRPFSPLREVAYHVAEIELGTNERCMFAVYGHGAEMMPLYSPEARSAVSLAELEALVAEAREQGTRLLVAYGYEAFNRAEVPDGFTWLDDPERFVVIDSWQGIDPDSSQTLLEWRGENARE